MARLLIAQGRCATDATSVATLLVILKLLIMNMTRRLSTTLVCLSLSSLLLSACGVREDEEISGTGSTTGASGGQSATAGAAAGSTPPTQNLTGRYAGTFLQRCLPIDNRGPNFNNRFGVLSLFINNNGVTATHYYYADSSCAQPSIPATVETNYQLSFPGGSVPTGRGEAEFANFGFESLIFGGSRPSSADQNALAPLGYYDSIYDIMLLDESALYVGSGRYKNTPEDRPGTLSADAFIRQ